MKASEWYFPVVYYTAVLQLTLPDTGLRDKTAQEIGYSVMKRPLRRKITRFLELILCTKDHGLRTELY